MIKEWEKPAIVDLLGYLYWNSSWLVAYEATLSHTIKHCLLLFQSLTEERVSVFSCLVSWGSAGLRPPSLRISSGGRGGVWRFVSTPAPLWGYSLVPRLSCMAMKLGIALFPSSFLSCVGPGMRLLLTYIARPSFYGNCVSTCLLGYISSHITWPLPEFISEPWSGSGLGTRLLYLFWWSWYPS